MALSCPHCNEAIPGLVKQETMTERINAKAEENRLLAAKVAELTETAASASAASTELATVRAELTGLQRRLKLSERGISDPQVIAAMEAIYASQHVGTEDAPAFEDVDAWAKDHVLLSHLFRETPAAPAPPNGTTPATPRAPIPVRDSASEDAPPRQGRMTPAQLREYFQSPTFLAMPPDQRKAKTAELREMLHAGA